MIVEQLEALIRGAPLGALDNVSQDVWRALSEGLLSEDQAQRLAEAIHARKAAHRGTAGVVSGGPGATSAKTGRSWSYFPAKRLQRSPDRTKSLERRRTLAATSPLPPALACKFTTGELAVLKIVADEVRAKGDCTLSMPEIAARAGVGLTKARMALRIAASFGLLTTEERRVPYKPNLSNIVRVVSREWTAWLTRRKPRVSFSGSKELRPSKAPSGRQGEGSLLRSPRNQRVISRAREQDHGLTKEYISVKR